MDALSQLRGLIAALDETLVDNLCARARLRHNEPLYALPGAPIAGLAQFHKSCIRFGQPDDGVGSPKKSVLFRPGAGTPSSRSSFPLRMKRYNIPGNALDALAGQFTRSSTLPSRVEVLRPPYLLLLLPILCEPGSGDDRSACLDADAACLDALARRLALSVHVATRKREAIPEILQAALRTGNPARVEQAITHPTVEAEVLARVRTRARQSSPRVETPDQIAALYAEWIIPLSRKIQVHGLLTTP